MTGRWLLLYARFPRLTALVTSLLIHATAFAACFISVVWWFVDDQDAPKFGLRQGMTSIELTFLPPEEESTTEPIQIAPPSKPEESPEPPLETKPQPRTRGIDSPALELPSVTASAGAEEQNPKILVALPPLTSVSESRSQAAEPNQKSETKRDERHKQRAGQNAAVGSQGADEYVDARLQVIPPIYPDEMLRRKVGGTVLLELHIAADGAVTRVSIVRSSGFPLFDAAAINAASKWRGIPAQRAGIPVETMALQEVIFKTPR